MTPNPPWWNSLFHRQVSPCTLPGGRGPPGLQSCLITLRPFKIPHHIPPVGIPSSTVQLPLFVPYRLAPPSREGTGRVTLTPAHSCGNSSTTSLPLYPAALFLPAVRGLKDRTGLQPEIPEMVFSRWGDSTQSRAE